MPVMCLADTALLNLCIKLHPRGLQENTEKQEKKRDKRQARRKVTEEKPTEREESSAAFRWV